MALTKVSTDGVKDDAITSGKIPANAVGASELADNAVDTNAIANNAVTAGKTSGVATTINGNAATKVILGSASANTLNASSNLIFDSGKLGIGTSSPSQELTVAGSDPVISVQEASVSSQVDIGTGTSTGFINIQKADGTRTVQLSGSTDSYFTGGNLGVGINNPTTLLHLKVNQQTAKMITLNGDDARNNYIGINGGDNLEIAADEDAAGSSSSIRFRVDGTERMRIDSNGRLGIGTTTPNYLLDLQVASDDAQMRLRTDGTGTGDDTIFRMQVAGTTQDNWIYFGDSADSNAGQIRYNHQSDFMAFTTNATERIRLNSDGLYQANSGNDTAYTLSIAGAVRFQFVHSGGGNMVISNPSTGNVTYSTSSDYRLKENVSSINNALNTVKALKPYQFTWKHDSKIGQGFFAHEVLETVPNSQAAIGTKDAVELEDDDKRGVKKGDPIYQGMDYAKLVPLLTAALQEEISKREALETRVAALEAA